jgi:serine protease Do
MIRRISRRLVSHLASSALLGLFAVALLPAAPALAQKGPNSVAPIAERLIDAVVNISTSQTIKGPQGVPLPKVPKGSPFEEFFDDFFSKKGGGGKSQSDRKVSSLGSGFVIDGKEGLVVTNNHVIDGADEIIINFHDGTKLKVDKVLGRDTKTDLALLKVTPKKPLPEAKFGSSAAMKVGDWVMAIGNPFGLGGSVTVGVVSAKQRDIQSGPYDDYIQTDASINKGNSGGPLFNMDGDVIGVNTAIISPSGGSIGIGFAVPSDNAMVVLDQLKQHGETRRGWLGIKVQSITEDIAETLGVKENQGALISSVTPKGPAATAGIEAGDVVLKFDGKDVTTVRGLPKLVAQTQIGRTVDVELQRKGQKKTVKVTLGRLTEDETTADGKKGPTPSETAPSSKALLGLSISPLTDELRAKFNIGKLIKGVVVTEVDPQSAVASKNIKVGDVIVEAAQEPVSGLDDIAKAIDKIKKIAANRCSCASKTRKATCASSPCRWSKLTTEQAAAPHSRLDQAFARSAYTLSPQVGGGEGKSTLLPLSPLSALQRGEGRGSIGDEPIGPRVRGGNESDATWQTWISACCRARKRGVVWMGHADETKRQRSLIAVSSHQRWCRRCAADTARPSSARTHRRASPLLSSPCRCRWRSPSPRA